MRDAAVAAISVSLSPNERINPPANLSASFQMPSPPFSSLPVEERQPVSNKMGLSITGAKSRIHRLSLVSRHLGPFARCGTRETLNQLLFDDFLSAAFAVVCSRSVAPLQSHLRHHVFNLFASTVFSPPPLTPPNPLSSQIHALRP